MEGVIIVGSNGGVVAARVPPFIDAAQVGTLCYSGAPMLVLTPKTTSTSSVVEGRRFAFSRNLRVPPRAMGRYDVGSPETVVACCVTRHADGRGAMDLLARLEGELLLGSDDLEEAIVRCSETTSISSLLRPGWVDAREVGALVRRLRSINELRKLLGAVLCERRVLFFGRREIDVSRCVAGAAALPELAFGADVLCWPHVLAMLGASTLAYVGSPSPYILGIRSSRLDASDDFLGENRSDVVVVDVDAGLVTPLLAGGETKCLLPSDDLGEIRFAKEVGAVVKRAEPSDATVARRRDDRRRRDRARRAKVEELGRRTKQALSSAKKRFFRKPHLKNDDIILRDEPRAIDSDSDSDSDSEEDPERFFFDHYFEEEDDVVECARVDAAVAAAIGALVRALLGRPRLVPPASLDDARRLFVADRADKAPSLEAFAREFAQTQMFAAWALGVLTKPPTRRPPPAWATPPPDDVPFVLSALAKNDQSVTSSRPGPALDAAFAEYGAACRALALQPTRAATDLAVALFDRATSTPRSALVRAAAVLMDDDASRRRRKRRRLDRDDKNSRLAAARLALAALLRGPPACVATVVNELGMPLTRAARDDDPDLRDTAAVVLALASDRRALLSARDHFDDIAKQYPPPHRQPRVDDLLGRCSFPAFASLHEANAPRATLSDARLRLAYEQQPRACPSPLEADLLGLYDDDAFSKHQVPTTTTNAALLAFSSSDDDDDDDDGDSATRLVVPRDNIPS
ncbi:hypothetical protein CTAYLR_007756 [Chrysophaeum taylorii]|uniref:cDENN domain-containing protein n=1 Tax=Chrysophaeum taylorii TaxID=2483200 RepID=A0AAD7XMD3_9STRA|nr:hypothetical protein CTAYLR_007756 [Chrysophaeum taylorii]